MSTCIERLAEARTARHDLLTGQAVVRVQFEGESTEFTEADLGHLTRYIRELEAECGSSGDAGYGRAPARVLY